MRNLFYLTFLALVFFLVVGWFMDWYSLTSINNSNGKTRLQFEVDTQKVSADLNKGKEKLTKTIDALRKEKGYETSFDW